MRIVPYRQSAMRYVSRRTRLHAGDATCAASRDLFARRRCYQPMNISLVATLKHTGVR
jgi:hypothetical protein